MTREADQEGPNGKAWLIEPTRDEEGASLGSWLVNVPNQHQFWSWWVVAVVHLREGEYLPPPVKAYEDAEYEFTILTVDPKASPNPNPELAETEGLSFLAPADIVEQFHGIGERDAAVVAALSVNRIIRGDISPDYEYRPKWKQLLEETVKGFQTGVFGLN